MAEETPKKAGKGLGKKVGGLAVWEWAGVVVGAYLVYRWWANRQAAAATGTTSGLPASTSDTGTSGTVTSTAPGTFAQWIEAALAGGSFGPNYTQTQAFNDLNAYTNGGCVSSSAGANFVTSVISSLGVPPGTGFTTPITICTQTTAQKSGAITAAHAAYDQAISELHVAQSAHAPQSTIDALVRNVAATQAVAQGTAGTPQAHAAYDEAISALHLAQKNHAPQATIAKLAQQVALTQSIYGGKPV